MADESTQPGGTPGAFMNDLEAGIRQEYTGRLEQMRQQVREARDRAAAERICGQQATEEMTRRMAEYRRGRWYHVGALVGSAGAGFAAGYHTQKHADLRVFGAPAAAVVGLPGVVAGALLDESVATRGTLAVGGAMFIVGAATYVRVHPRDEGTS
jgi:hypothetical protein